MIRFSKEEGFIKPTGIKFREGQDANIVLPNVAVGVFSKELVRDVVQKFNCMEVGYIACANFEKNVYILNYKDTLITFFMAGVGGPHISSDIEELSANGVRKFIIFGNCGVLDSSIEDCSIIIPNKAFRDEGVSYHYKEESDAINLNPKYKEEFIKILDEYNFSFYEGATWTTDAFYRETPDKIKYFKENGAITVEMEGSVIGSVCEAKNLDYFTFYYAGDNLDSTTWEERSLSELTNFDKKQQVMLLALDFSIVLNNINE